MDTLGGLAIKKKQEHCVYFRAWKFPKSPLVLLFIGLLKNKKKSLQISEFQPNLYQKPLVRTVGLAERSCPCLIRVKDTSTNQVRVEMLGWSLLSHLYSVYYLPQPGNETGNTAPGHLLDILSTVHVWIEFMIFTIDKLWKGKFSNHCTNQTARTKTQKSETDNTYQQRIQIYFTCNNTNNYNCV